MEQQLSGQIQKLLEELQTSTLVQRHRKKAMNSFARYYFQQFPEPSVEQAAAIIQGDARHKGLVHTIGRRNQMGDTFKLSSVLALELLARLLDPAENIHAPVFMQALSELGPATLREMRLDRHILGEPDKYPGSKQIVFQLVSVVVGISQSELSGFVESAEACRAFYEWEAECAERDDHQELSDVEGGNDSTAMRKGPTKWADVDEEALYEESLRVADPQLVADEDAPWDQEGRAVDPLGLGAVGESRLRRRPSTSLFRLHPITEHSGGSPDPLSEHFDAIVFLLHAHTETSFAQLVGGLKSLQASAASRQKQMRNLVKVHFDQFISSKNTIDSIHQLLGTEVSGGAEASRTARLERKAKLLRDTAHALYSPLLERKREADRIRRVLGLLKRFEFLFAVPGSLRRNIERRQYDQVVRDYQKVCKIKDSDVGLLQGVLEQVRGLLDGFREQLKAQLSGRDAALTDPERTISYLIDLDAEEPALFFLEHQFAWMVSLLGESSAGEKSVEFKISRDSGKSIDLRNSNDCKNANDSKTSTKYPLSVSAASQILTQRMESCWNVAWEVVNGKYQSRGDEGRAGKQRVRELMSWLLQEYCQRVRKQVIVSVDFEIVLSESLPANVSTVLTAFRALEELDIPHLYLKEISDLADECSEFYIRQRLCKLLGDVHEFAQESFQDVQQLLLLPQRFQQIVTKALEDVEGIRLLSRQPLAWIPQLIVPFLLESFRALADLVHFYAFESKLLKIPREQSLLALCTVLHTSRKHVLHGIVEVLGNRSPPNFLKALDPVLDECLVLFAELEYLLVETFTRKLVLNECRMLRRGLMMCGSQLMEGQTNVPRAYMISVLSELARNHQLVQKLAPEQVSLVMESACERVAGCLKECVEGTDLWRGAMGVIVLGEALFFKRVVERYLSAEASADLARVESILRGVVRGVDVDQAQGAAATACEDHALLANSLSFL